MDALKPQDPPHIGTYTLLARLGAGGMGQVHLGRSPGGRLVAIKVIRDEITDHPEALARFRREVETARTVRSAYTANLIDASLDRAPYWLATEYVSGPTLAQAVTERGPLPAETCRGLFAALAEGLAAVHAHGVTHRDLKPQNVILSPQGPLLIDFGIARGIEDTALTQTGFAPGTPGYSAPEVLVRNQVSPSVDVFALGATMAYAVTGRPPFGSGAAHAVSYRVVHEEIDVAGAEPGLAALIQECVVKDPARRPALDAVIARCSVSSSLAEDPAYVRLTADAERPPPDLAAAVAAGLAPAASAQLPTAGPGYIPTVGPRAHIPTLAPMQQPTVPVRARPRRTRWVVGITAAAVVGAASAVALRTMQDGGQGGRQEGSATPPASASVAASASASTAVHEVPAYIENNRISNDYWRLSTKPDEVAHGIGQCGLINAVSPPGDLQTSVSGGEDPESAYVGEKAKISFRFKYAELSESKPAPYYVSVGVKPPHDIDDETGKPFDSMGPNKSIGYTSKPVDIYKYWKGGGFIELTYPDDFQSHFEGHIAPGIPVQNDPGDWTAVLYHVKNSPTDYDSFGCTGFHVPGR
ncbi:serine/threonine-protein kinase [Streptomyces sp. NPDC002589]|uniref:serine/threonine protein kinase n=1 Tax=Streptomyces sp. NPDC002589 TaxID=3154420 RepID=UPI003330309F